MEQLIAQFGVLWLIGAFLISLFGQWINSHKGLDSRLAWAGMAGAGIVLYGLRYGWPTTLTWDGIDAWTLKAGAASVGVIALGTTLGTFIPWLKTDSKEGTPFKSATTPIAALLCATFLALCVAAPPASAGIGTRNFLVSASSGYASIAGNGEKWQGADLCPALTLSLHPALAAHVSYDAAFARGRESEQILRAQGQMRLYPLPDAAPEANRLDLSAGGLWMRDWSGFNTQLSASHFFNAHAFAFAMAAHAFSADPAQKDRDFIRVGLGLGAPLGK